jgi:predicted DNA-binding protein (UPF0251 family)
MYTMAEPPAPEEGIRRRGRPRVRRESTGSGPFCCYAPQCDIRSERGAVILLPDEIDILRLIDLNGLEQEEAARILGISRRTLWKDLHETRRKVADALVHGKLIEIAGCSRRIQGGCPKREMPDSPGDWEGICPRREEIEPDFPDPEGNCFTGRTAGQEGKDIPDTAHE